LVSLVLIAASQHLAALQKQPEFTDAEAFPETDALKALDAITRTRPQVIVLDHIFAASARGAALVNRIKADPSLAACEIRIVEATAATTPEPAPAPVPPAPSERADTAAAVAVETAAATRLDTGTRRAQRYVISGNVDVLVDGSPAALVNISVVGAQVISPSSLRPNQRVRMSLVDEARPIRFNGVVAWASFEMPKEGPRYRAGINFYDAAPEMVTRFIESITTT
jgi:CHASE2 domain-containing sensor protein